MQMGTKKSVVGCGDTVGKAGACRVQIRLTGIIAGIQGASAESKVREGNTSVVVS